MPLPVRHSRAALRRLALRFFPAMLVATVVATGIVPVAHGSPPPEVRSIATPVGKGPVEPGFQAELETGLPAQMIGFHWGGATEGEVELRVFEGGRWSEWFHLQSDPDEGPDPGSAERRQRSSAGPMWVGDGVRRVQVRVGRGRLTDLTMHAIRSDEPGPGGGTATAGAAVARPPITTRAQWGADESYRTHAPGCTGTPEYAAGVRNAIVHHTAGSNSYGPEDADDLMRGIYKFHTHTNLWCDIGYNFVVDRYGQILEGRAGGVDRAVIGAHAGGFNTGSTGVALMGSFDTSPVPSASYSSLVSLLAWKLDLHGVDPNGQVTVTSGGSSRYPAGTRVVLPTISGHRDVSATLCPGQVTYEQLAALRSAVGRRILEAVGTVVLACDWNGDGVDTPGVVREGRFSLRNSNSAGGPDLSFLYGRAADQPVCGDWDGDGDDTVGVVRGSIWHLRNENAGGVADVSFDYGRAGDVPVTGDWDANRSDTAGVVRGSTWHLRNANSGGVADMSFDYGRAGDVPVTGDWDANRSDTAGVVRGSTWHLRHQNAGGAADVSFLYGRTGDAPVTGDWDADRSDTAGVVRGSTWHLRNENAGGAADVSFDYRVP